MLKEEREKSLFWWLKCIFLSFCIYMGINILMWKRGSNSVISFLFSFKKVIYLFLIVIYCIFKIRASKKG